MKTEAAIRERVTTLKVLLNNGFSLASRTRDEIEDLKLELKALEWVLEAKR